MLPRQKATRDRIRLDALLDLCAEIVDLLDSVVSAIPRSSQGYCKLVENSRVEIAEFRKRLEALQ